MIVAKCDFYVIKYVGSLQMDHTSIFQSTLSVDSTPDISLAILHKSFIVIFGPTELRIVTKRYLVMSVPYN